MGRARSHTGQQKEGRPHPETSKRKVAGRPPRRPQPLRGVQERAAQEEVCRESSPGHKLPLSGSRQGLQSGVCRSQPRLQERPSPPHPPAA